ncbi:hypothetical protein H5200_23045 [Pseudoalteromonas sp. SG43-7]|jgi:hypothetical protein|uniref:hypothetical protein n=1 Tax=unclassified Pseudoalteromonas TaxID=194690 RepID=UPI000D6ECEF5|nr:MULTISPECIES: hypothetical protein [unclassified Pseudoalteromonas]MBB1424742.1 hypothetical protein [Pseudoalteromonas sp. SG43-7]PWS56513.1 hypothetical protein DK924_07200 [Pseudoalteromonas sp. meg-B1]
MGSKLERKELELYKRTDEILHYVWDPIGVADIPGARDEYHSYLPKVFKLVLNDSKNHEISSYLEKVESGSMGLTPYPKKNLEVANLLLETKEWIFEQTT